MLSGPQQPNNTCYHVKTFTFCEKTNLHLNVKKPSKIQSTDRDLLIKH